MMPPRDAPPEAANTVPSTTWPFFCLAFALTWGAQLPSLLAQRGWIVGPPERYLPLLGLGAFGPLLAAVISSHRRLGGPGGRALFGRLWVRGVGLGWYLAAPLFSGFLLVLGLAAYDLLSGSSAGPWFYLPLAPERIVAMVVFSVGEEVGWRGYALPRLRARYGVLPASLLLGLLWGAWHLPMFLLAGLDLGMILLMIVAFLPAGSVTFGWFFERTGGSLSIAILLHMGAHLNNSHLALPADPRPAVIHTAAYVLAAALLVLVDRRWWRSPTGKAR
jgi:membrane protease YdiL (CAAX protease family)